MSGIDLDKNEELCDDLAETQAPSKNDVFEIVADTVGIEEVPIARSARRIFNHTPLLIYHR